MNPRLIPALGEELPPSQIITDELRRLAYGTDASFYRLIPQVIVVIHSELQARHVLQVAYETRTPITFRAAGTSLSGQALSDGILALIGEGFATCDVAADGATVRLGPGIIGGEVNRRLAPFGRKIGPDPASIGAAKIGGIAANNASGMCCGTAQNSYRTLQGLRVMMLDGTVLDTEEPRSKVAFSVSHAHLLAELTALAQYTRANTPLAERIRHKYKIKNTTGYSLNALVDFEDPFDILAHLMIGSEGTLGFISRITYRTVIDDPCKASALVFFPDIRSACEAVIRLKTQAEHAVSAAELLDRPALRSVEDKPGLPAIMRHLGKDAAALLIEVRAEDAAGVAQKTAVVHTALEGVPTVEGVHFSSDPATCEMYWKVRKGTFPAVGAMRKTGTTVLIEDIAFPIEVLAEATLDLQALLRQHGYNEAIIFGHALEGNLHFVITQDFASPSEIERYARFMDALCIMVVHKYDGSLKAEHGTGRNMAPFVELEWGREATALMRQIKQLFDPLGLLNPGVILNADPKAHLAHLKPMPAAHALIDRCIECGFCEPLCPSHQLTLSPRQRITGLREQARRQSAGEALGRLAKDYTYQGLDTCAGCGLCSTACPVGIDTGEMIRTRRGEALWAPSRAMHAWTGRHFGVLAGATRLGLNLGHALAKRLGQAAMTRLSQGAWRPPMPRAGRAPTQDPAARHTEGDPVVYFPTCGGRLFGSSMAGEPPLGEVILTLLRRAGYAPVLPEGFDALCCGQMLASKGMAREADALSARLEAALCKASDNGRHPIIMDASTCSARIKAFLGERLKLYDFPEFAHDALLPRLMIVRQLGPVALHVNCSVRKNGGDARLRALLSACVEHVIEPTAVTCCGFAGDRGFVVPELNQHALRHLTRALPEGCTGGVSTNRTCEIGLTTESGIHYRSIAYVLEECSRKGVYG